MHYLKSMLPILVTLMFCSLSEAQKDHCASAMSYQQIIQCAEEQSVQVQNAKASLKINTSLKQAAQQWKNPELSVEKFSDTDVMLQFPIELGGKRSSRLEFANAQHFKAANEVALARNEARKEVRLRLERLRQVYEELALVTESLQTFSKLVKQYEGRPTLSAEQKVSLNVYKLAKGDYVFRKLEQEEELQELNVYFQLNLGLTASALKKLNLSKVTKWPAISDEAVDFKGSTQMVALRGDVDLARAELSSAQANAWPELRIGPSLKILSDRSESERPLWGMNLNLSLPILSLNGGVKSAALNALQASELKVQLAERALKTQRDSLVEQYRQSVRILENPEFSQSMEEKHQQIESLFIRGVVPSSLIIESHRSMVDFDRSRNARILKALEIYLNVQSIDGRGNEESL